MIGFLNEFWSAITSATEGTVEWFQSLGNAVAGALGNLLFYPLQAVIDFGLAIAYLMNQLLSLISYLISPFLYFFTFLGAVLNYMFQPATASVSLPPLTTSIITVLNIIPYFGYFLAAITAALWIKVILSTLHTLKH